MGINRCKATQRTTLILSIVEWACCGAHVILKPIIGHDRLQLTDRSNSDASREEVFNQSQTIEMTSYFKLFSTFTFLH